MSFVDILTTVGFLFAILMIGLIAAKRVNTNSDYLIAGNRVGKWPLALSLAATDMGGAGIIGAMALAYSIGISGSFWDICAVPAFLILAFILPKIFAGRREITVPELMGNQYDEKTRTIVAFLQLISAAIVIAVQNVVTSIVIQTLTGVPFEYALLISAVVFIIYTTAGGMISVIWTDIFAFIILFATMIAAVLIFTLNMGGLEAVTNSLPSHYWNFDGVSGMTLGGWVMMNMFIYATSQPYIQRVLAAKEESSVKFAYIFTGLAYVVFGLLVALLGIFAFNIDPSLKDAGYGSIRLIFMNLPHGIRSMLMVTFMAATMSTGSSYLNGCASICTIDIYKRLINKNASDLDYLRVAKLSTVLIAVISLVISYFIKDVIEFVVYANMIYAATIFFPLMLCYKIKWLSANGAFYGILGGFLFGVIYSTFLHGTEVGMIHPIFIAAIFSFVILMTVSYLEKRKSVLY